MAELGPVPMSAAVVRPANGQVRFSVALPANSSRMDLDLGLKQEPI